VLSTLSPGPYAYRTAGVNSWRRSHLAACFGVVARWAFIRLLPALRRCCVRACGGHGLQRQIQETSSAAVQTLEQIQVPA
jgi:hypothetical protein